VVSFDRRGDVLWIDPAEDSPSKRWTITTAGTGGEVKQSWLYCRNGESCYQLTGGSDGDLYAMISAPLPLEPDNSRVGFEFSFAFDSNVAAIEIGIKAYDGVNRFDYLLRYTISTKILAFYNSLDTWETIDTLDYDLFEGPPGWHTIKLVIDPTNELPARALLDNFSYDIGAYIPDSAADANSPCLQLQAKALSDSGQNGVVYVDDLILTTNEPGNR
jgi:hypothetical protein